MPGFNRGILTVKINPEKHLCPQCELILNDPVQSSCGHRYCKDCLQTLIESSQTHLCPRCLQEGCSEGDSTIDADFVPDFVLKREFITIAVKCINNGCSWKGVFGNYEAHEANCSYKTKLCSHPGCGKYIQTAAYKFHTEKECPYRPFYCKRCNGAIAYKFLKKHNTTECPKSEVECQYCGKKLFRDTLSSHQDNETGDCPRSQSNNCVFAQFGCNTKLSLYTAEKHLQDNIQEHLTLLCRAFLPFFKVYHKSDFNTKIKQQDKISFGKPESKSVDSCDEQQAGASTSSELEDVEQLKQLASESLLATPTLLKSAEVRQFISILVKEFMEVHLKSGFRPQVSEDSNYEKAAESPSKIGDSINAASTASHGEGEDINVKVKEELNKFSEGADKLAKIGDNIGATATATPVESLATEVGHMNIKIKDKKTETVEEVGKGLAKIVDAIVADKEDISLKDMVTKQGRQIKKLEKDLRILDRNGKTYQDAMQVLSDQSEEIGKQINKINERLKVLEEFKSSMTSLPTQLAVLQNTILEMQEKITENENATHNGIIIWKISDYGKKRREAIQQGSSIYSPVFYSGPHGYKMCCRLFLNGDGVGKGSHFSIFFMLLRGKYDATLPWPFKHIVKFMLIDQNNFEHIMDGFKPEPNSTSFQRPKSERNIPTGCPLFITPNEVEKSRNAYIKEDTMFIRVSVELKQQ
ncbi:TNF receptor-associated factor 2-like [Antedon mediterranea]|uniref:TNF receptor-associated factor 2-like n=1 Tax=Antedon mediterranea TaxID=105859 RepID=UPI003AF57B8A